MILHFKNISLCIITALFGLLLYLITASSLGWIQPIWWGGEAFVFPVFFGGISVFISAIFYYAITVLFNLVKLKYKSIERMIVTPAILLGFLFFPCFELFIFVKNVIPGWSHLNPLSSLFIGLIITSMLSITITITIVILAALFKKD